MHTHRAAHKRRHLWMMMMIIIYSIRIDCVCVCVCCCDRSHRKKEKTVISTLNADERRRKKERKIPPFGLLRDLWINILPHRMRICIQRAQHAAVIAFSTRALAPHTRHGAHQRWPSSTILSSIYGLLHICNATQSVNHNYLNESLLLTQKLFIFYSELNNF